MMAAQTPLLLTLLLCCSTLLNPVNASPTSGRAVVLGMSLLNRTHEGSLLEMRGSGFHRTMLVKLTREEKRCDVEPAHDVFPRVVSANTQQWLLRLDGDPPEPLLYTCLSEDDRWIHQGTAGLLRTNSIPSQHSSYRSRSGDEGGSGWRKRRAFEEPNVNGGDAAGSVTVSAALDTSVRLYGFKVERADADWSTSEDGIPEIRVGTSAYLRIFGHGITNATNFVLTDRAGTWGHPCEYPAGEKRKAVMDPSVNSLTGLLKIDVPKLSPQGTVYYLCFQPLKNDSSKSEQKESFHFVHLGSETFLSLGTYDKILPLWVSIIIILICLSFSSLFSGLNLGLMSLDRTDLKIICNTGTEKERDYAQAIMPVRQHGNYLLCSILLGNVMVNSTFTILLDDLTSGVVAVVASTLAIVIFGEITPQAICSRHGLAVGAKTISITKLVMIITCPLSYPISKLLDWILGEEIGAVYTRERLKELVKLTTEYNDLQKDEVNIISGVLELKQKVVADVMTKLEDVFMLSYDAVLDFETVSEIMKSGFSRVPVYEGERSNIVTMLYIKDLALIDPDDNMSLKTVCQFYQNTCYFVFEDTSLDVLFKQFKEGIKGHMAFVHKVNNEGEGDPFYEAVGIVTLEDVIEELIQSEIMDETDVWTDNRSKKRRHHAQRKQDFSVFAERSENQRIHISPQLTLATFQFLSTSVDAFKPENITETVLKRLLKQDVFFHIKIKNKDRIKTDPNMIIYSQGKPVDYFVLILEGRVEVTVGRENLIFESGPFTFFGSQALTQNVGLADSPTNISQPLGSLQSVNLDSKLRVTFIPDYTVRAITEVFYLRVKRGLYLAAKRATLMELSRKEESTAGDTFEDEVEKMMTIGVEDSRSQGSPDVTRTHSQQVSERESPLALNNGALMTGSEPTLPSASCLPLPPPHQSSSDLPPRSHQHNCSNQEETLQLLDSLSARGEHSGCLR